MMEEIERRWRLANETPASRKRAHAVADIVTQNLSKFEKAHEYAAELTRKREVAAHSRLNPNARPFVPHEKKAEAPAAPRNLASGAQL